MGYVIEHGSAPFYNGVKVKQDMSLCDLFRRELDGHIGDTVHDKERKEMLNICCRLLLKDSSNDKGISLICTDAKKAHFCEESSERAWTVIKCNRGYPLLDSCCGNNDTVPHTRRHYLVVTLCSTVANFKNSDVYSANFLFNWRLCENHCRQTPTRSDGKRSEQRGPSDNYLPGIQQKCIR